MIQRHAMQYLRTVALAVFAFAGPAASAWAAQATITAVYRGQSDGHFVNTTPKPSFCYWATAFCAREDAVALPVTYTKEIVNDLRPFPSRPPVPGDPRSKAYLQLPGSRTVSVVHQQTADSYELRFEMIAVAQEVRSQGVIGAPVVELRGAGCSLITGDIGEGWEDENGQPIGAIPPWGNYLLAIRNPASPQPCYLDNAQGSDRPGERGLSDFFDLGIGYRLYMPRPVRMRPGVYTGSVHYSIGPGGDFDFGDGVSGLNTNDLTIHFELDVQHDFRVELPPGGERAVLEPPGGWMAWLGGRGVPPRLYRNLPMRVWSTGPFRIYKQCQYDVNGGCGIRNGNGHEVPVSVAVSLPAGVEHGGSQVSHLTIPSGEGQALWFEQATMVSNRPGELHFEVEQRDVEQMLAHHAGTKYEGLVTVVFDSEL